MTLGRLFGFWALLGAGLGLILFAAVYLLRDTLAAGADLSEVTISGNRSALVLVIPGLGIGWLAFTLTSKLCSDAGLRRMGPILLGCLAALAVTLGLVHQFMSEYWAVAVMPATLTVIAIVATAWVCDWLDS